MNNIKKIRKEKGISITELAKCINMSQSNLTKIENNQLKPKEDIIVKIAQTLNVSKEILFNVENGNNNSNMLPIINSVEIDLPDLSLYPMLKCLYTPSNPNIGVYITQDDSMSPTINKSSIAVIDKETKSFTQNGVYLIKINNKFALRRLQEAENNTVYLLPDNKTYLNQQIGIEDLNIIGRAIHVLNSCSI